MKKLISILVSLIIMMSVFCSCSQNEPISEKVAILIPYGESGFPAGLKYCAEKYVSEYELEYQIFTAKNAEEQTQQIQNITAEEYGAALLLPMGDQKSAAESMRQKGVKLMYFINKSGDNYDAYYTLDNATVGRTAALYLYSKRQEVGTAATAVITVEDDAEQKQRAESFTAEAEKYPVIDLKGTYTAKKMTENSIKSTVRSALSKNSELVAIYCTDDYIAATAMEVIKSRSRDDIEIIIGSGGKQEFLKSFEDDSRLLATAYYSPVMIRDALITIKAMVEGQSYNKDTVLSSHMIDKENVRQYIDINSVF